MRQSVFTRFFLVSVGGVSLVALGAGCGQKYDVALSDAGIQHAGLLLEEGNQPAGVGGNESGGVPPNPAEDPADPADNPSAGVPEVAEAAPAAGPGDILVAKPERSQEPAKEVVRGSCESGPDRAKVRKQEDHAVPGIACKPNKVRLCHIPQGNPAAKHTLCVGKAAVDAHLANGDALGDCPL